MKKQHIDQFWAEFLRETNRPQDSKYLESFHFCSNETDANNLLELVLQGIKKATASALPGYVATGDKVPAVGDYSIVTNWDGEPKCVIQTTTVDVIPFCDMTFDICKREGEDENLQSWQDNHVKAFTEYGKQDGFDFTWDMPVVFEDFEVVWVQKY